MTKQPLSVQINCCKCGKFIGWGTVLVEPNQPYQPAPTVKCTECANGELGDSPKLDAGETK